MYHIVYLTTNLVNNKIYVGVHNNLDSSYLGSGKILKQAISKYGIKNFKRQILYYCLEVSHAYEIESQIVNQSFIDRNDTYNLVKGGNIPPSIRTKESILKQKETIIKNGGRIGLGKGRKIPQSQIEKTRLTNLSLNRKLTSDHIEKLKIASSKPKTAEAKIKMSKAKKDIPKLVYTLNSPDGESFNIIGYDQLECFLKERSLTINTFRLFLNKGKIKLSNRQINDKRICRCQDWQISSKLLI